VGLVSLEVSIKKKLKGFSLDVSFVNEGRCMGILGASGCGKSMTLKCIAGIEKPDEGSIILNGKELYHSDKKINKTPQVRKVGYLFQNYALFPNMTVSENISVGIQLPKAGKEEKIREYLERFHLEGLGRRYPSELSGGQQQRVALARILAYQPDLIMLDEPFSALDSFLKDSLQRELFDILKEYHGDVIIVSHSRDEIYKFCDQLVIMDAGNKLLSGNTKDIFNNPKVMEAARLTGCKNISPIRKLGEYELLAIDWNMKLKTVEPIGPKVRYVGIRARNILPSYEADRENTFPVVLTGQSEAPLEFDFLLKNKNYLDGTELWWKVHKKQGNYFNEEGQSPLFVTLPKEDLMLLE
jgi:molybdate transport system ATP-binding protein